LGNSTIKDRGKLNTHHQGILYQIVIKAGTDVTALNDETIQCLHFLAKDDLDTKTVGLNFLK